MNIFRAVLLFNLKRCLKTQTLRMSKKTTMILTIGMFTVCKQHPIHQKTNGARTFFTQIKEDLLKNQVQTPLISLLILVIVCTWTGLKEKKSNKKCYNSNGLKKKSMNLKTSHFVQVLPVSKSKRNLDMRTFWLQKVAKFKLTSRSLCNNLNTISCSSVVFSQRYLKSQSKLWSRSKKNINRRKT